MKALYKKLLPFCWIALLVLFVPATIKRGTPDSDTFFILSTGRYIVETGTVPTTNPFVIHSGFDMVVQQWGFDVVIYWIYNHFGYVGLAVYAAAAYTAFVVLMYQYIKLFKKNTLATALSTLIASVLFIPFANSRPTSLTVILLLLHAYFLEKYHQSGKWKYLIAFPILSLIHINTHASTWIMLFVLTLPYIAPYYVPSKAERRQSVINWWNRNKLILLFAAIAFIVAFINPNGINGMLYLFNSYSNATEGLGISELQAPTLADSMGALCLTAILTIFIYITINLKNLRNLQSMHSECIRVYMAVGTTIMACMHIRNQWYLIFGAVPICAILLSKLPTPIHNRKKELSDSKCTIRLIAIFLLPAILSALLCSFVPFSATNTQDSQHAPIKALEYLDNLNKEDVTLYTEFNNGAFFEWHGYQVYIDARPELFAPEINHKKDVLKEYLGVNSGKLDYQNFLNEYQFTHLLVTNPVLSIYLAALPDYKIVVQAEQYSLFEKVVDTQAPPDIGRS